MKTYAKLVSIFTLFIILLCSTGCEKEKNNYEGNVYIEFKETPNQFWIFPMDGLNTTYIYESSSPEKIFNMPLNMGNYIIKCTTENSSFTASKGFQIKNGKTTSLYFDENQKWHVFY